MTAPTVYEGWADCRATKKVQPVLGGFDKGNYRTERLWATASDGTKVPMSVVYKQGVAKRDGSDPLLLNGYSHAVYAWQKGVHICVLCGQQ